LRSYRDVPGHLWTLKMSRTGTESHDGGCVWTGRRSDSVRVLRFTIQEMVGEGGGSKRMRLVAVPRDRVCCVQDHPRHHRTGGPYTIPSSYIDKPDDLALDQVSMYVQLLTFSFPVYWPTFCRPLRLWSFDRAIRADTASLVALQSTEESIACAWSRTLVEGSRPV
jgi:hypothetical protein